jgi:hypothetical protein
VRQESGRKSSGAVGVSNPNDPGGLGDATGVSMLERLQKDPYPIDVRPTKERLIKDGAERLTSPTAASEH